jgi:hypothetical protein
MPHLPWSRSGQEGQIDPTINLDFFGVIRPVGGDAGCGG